MPEPGDMIKSCELGIREYAKGLGICILAPGEPDPDRCMFYEDFCVSRTCVIESEIWACDGLRHACDDLASHAMSFLDGNAGNIVTIRNIIGPYVSDDVMAGTQTITLSIHGTARCISSDGTIVKMEGM